jgi:hypothetical protein
MKGSTIFRSPLRRWLSVFGIVLGAVLVQLTFAAPAHAGDLGFPYGGYGPIGGYGGYGRFGGYGGYGRFGGGYGGGYGCGYCGCGQPCGCGVSCYPPVIERRFVVRSYYERRSPYCCGSGGFGGGFGGYGGGFGGYGGGFGGYGGGFGGYGGGFGGYGGGYYPSAFGYGDGFGFGGY